MKVRSFRTFLFFFIFVILLVLAGEVWLFQKNKQAVEKSAVVSIRQAGRSFSASFENGFFPGTENFSRLVNSLFRTYENLLSVTIYSPEDGIFYHKEGNKQLLDSRSLQAELWKGRPEYSFQPSYGLFLVESSPLSFSPGNDKLLMVEVSHYAGFTDSNYKLALTLFLLLIAFCLVAIFLLIMMGQEKQALVSGESAGSAAGALPPGKAVSQEAADKKPAEKSEPSVSLPIILPPPIPKEETPSAVSGSWENDSSPRGGVPPENGEPSQAAQPAQACIYSEKSGLGREELLEDKLNQELKRSASFDQDLVLVIFTLRGLEAPSNMQRFQTIIFETFPYRDLIFDYGKNAFALILPNMDLDSSVSPLENFQLKVEKAGFSREQKFSAGVSSRCGRLLTAHRLIMEASNAFKRARKEPQGGIILFRISPKKYRQVVAERNFL